MARATRTSALPCTVSGGGDRPKLLRERGGVALRLLERGGLLPQLGAQRGVLLAQRLRLLQRLVAPRLLAAAPRLAAPRASYIYVFFFVFLFFWVIKTVQDTRL